jgi:hypothetical protein
MSAGSLVGLVINFLVVGLIFGCMGFVCDKIILTANSSITGLMLSQDALNTLYYLSLAFKAIPFLYLLALLLNHIIQTSNETTGEV